MASETIDENPFWSLSAQVGGAPQGLVFWLPRHDSVEPV